MLKRLPLILCVCLCLFLACAAPAFAASPVGEVIDFTDYVYDISPDGQSVILSFPSSFCTWLVYPAGLSPVVSRQSPSVTFTNNSTSTAYLYPIGDQWERYLDVSDIPSGTDGFMSIKVDTDADLDDMTVHISVEYFPSNNAEMISDDSFYFSNTLDGLISGDFTLNIPDGAQCCIFRCDIENITDTGSVTLTLNDFYLDLELSALYLQQLQTGKTNAILERVEQQLEENGQTLDEILKEQEKLPDKIGDEMQGIIDNEKEQSKSEGNKFVDQILDALPDPSQDVLAALKGLTDATAYNGTDAVLPIPALALPGIDGLFPATELWSGTDFDLGEYVSMLPSGLLTLVQSLFTIAIVLFCVYELKGIISYCLTLRESKGG